MAGYEDQVEKKIHIDTTVPEITVEYDKNDPVNERFYQEARTATVSIKERNFAADDVEFLVTETDGVRPVIGEWTSEGTEDETVHRCQVTFSEDGEYTFSVKFQDKAGNQAAYDRIDEFGDRSDSTGADGTVGYGAKSEWQLLCKRTSGTDSGGRTEFCTERDGSSGGTGIWSGTEF